MITIRDLVRYAVSRFNAAGLSFGHGTSSALDDAVFLVLETLKLPIDELDPWLDARLTCAERETIVGLIERRVDERIPTPYLVGRAYIQGIPFHVDERVIVPRSFIGELLVSSLVGGEGFALIDDPEAVTSVVDICTGSGCLAILASRLFPNAEVDAVDLSPDALEVAAINVETLGADTVHLHQGDLFGPLAGRRYDLIVTNPPYVEAEVMAELPEEYRHEPEMALAGGHDGLDVVRRILAAAPDHIAPGGGLICEIGTGREILEAEYPDLPFLWLDTEESEAEVFWLTAEALGVA
nr:50S ribosomal protein L3 N(5)-glutamine methyltransferase [Oharaeibacter diazotrophicus]